MNLGHREKLKKKKKKKEKKKKQEQKSRPVKSPAFSGEMLSPSRMQKFLEISRILAFVTVVLV